MCVCACVRERQRECEKHQPAWIISLAHSLQGNKATYMVQPFTSALFLFIMAFNSAWHTVGQSVGTQVVLFRFH